MIKYRRAMARPESRMASTYMYLIGQLKNVQILPLFVKVMTLLCHYKYNVLCLSNVFVYFCRQGARQSLDGKYLLYVPENKLVKRRIFVGCLIDYFFFSRIKTTANTVVLKTM